ncbi:MAG: hypothetical protein UX78_C0003G0015 [Candidatus Amesbacteria bacterium GW2011_GWA2_47_11]|uniref:Uncharacterized protein n=2 Tax=Candidatus Amesiibacteriota TaxID=1752730 RepID=A0A0G1ULF8_9BACT|nr:MAG: hypothetical protein UX78_C0003G0015 [Candidatus Amesbacteria bacterium GW2011_GWA2_47_11]KKU94969.1 MAG: hypothetical protein UY22_C0003G0005 [Candidatus Amesbacteria bacterium GW2011_GWC1_48_10]
MLSKLKLLTTTATFRQSLVTVGSTVTSGILGALFYFLLARILGSRDYGAFAAVAALVTMLSSIFDLGTNQGLVKFSGTDPVAKLALIIKLFSGGLAVALFLIFAPGIASFLLHQPTLTPLVRLAGLGIFSSLLFSFIYTLAQSRSQYFLWGGVYVGPNLLRLIVIIWLFFTLRLTSFSALLVFTLAPFSAFLIGIFLTNRKFFSSRLSLPAAKHFFGFNQWITASTIIATLGSRIDTLLAVRLLNLSATGVYALAVQMITILPQITTALGAVTTPKFASFKTIADNRRYLGKTLVLSCSVALGSACLLAPFAWLVVLLVGPQFRGAYLPFIILLVAMSLFLGSSPIRDSLMYYFGRPRFFFWLGLASLIATVGLSLWLVPVWGIVGSAAVVLVIQIMSLVVSLAYYLYLSRRS